jgi:hypothetical protein
MDGFGTVDSLVILKYITRAIQPDHKLLLIEVDTPETSQLAVSNVLGRSGYW